MGKASRMKHIARKWRESNYIAAYGSSSKPATKGPTVNANEARQKSAARTTRPETLEDLLSVMSEGNVIVIDGNGVHGPEQARMMYWTDVCDGIRNRGVDCLPEMETLGRLMGLSLLGVKLPVVDHQTGRQIDENIFAAMFLLGQVECFKFLLDLARREGCDWELLGCVFRDVVSHVQNDPEESPQLAMAKSLVRFMAETFHQKQVLDQAMNDSKSVMGQPFARRVAQDYLDELAAQEERDELEDSIIQAVSQAESTPVRI